MISVVDRELLNKIYLEFKAKNLTIATAESCTGGLIGHTLTNIAGISDYYDRGIISYSNISKIELLDVSKELLIKYGAVSREVAREMSEGIRKKSGVDIGLSTTGIAGPSGGTKEKPVGLVYIAISNKKETIIKKFNFTGNRLDIKNKTCIASLKMLYKILSD